MTLWPLITGFVGGVIAWLFTTALAQPFQRFLTLRQEAAFALAEFEDRAWIGNPEAKPPSNDWLDKRLAAYDKAGTALVAFASSNSFVTHLLHHPVAGPYRCYVRAAGEGLRVLGATYPGTQAALTYRELVAGQLCITNGLARRPNKKFQRGIFVLGLLAWIAAGVFAGFIYSQNPFAKEAVAITRALLVVPIATIIAFVVGLSVLTPIALLLGVPSATISYVWRSPGRRWKLDLGLILLATAIVAIATRAFALLALTSSEQDTGVPAPPSRAK